MWVEKWERSVHHCHHGSSHLNPFVYVIDMKVYYKNHPHLYKLSSIYEEIWPVLLKICQFQSSKIIFDAPEFMLVGLKLGNMFFSTQIYLAFLQCQYYCFPDEQKWIMVISVKTYILGCTSILGCEGVDHLQPNKTIQIQSIVQKVRFGTFSAIPSATIHACGNWAQKF